jgi:RNA polymerase sigma-70 factor, ECF subfamily
MILLSVNRATPGRDRIDMEEVVVPTVVDDRVLLGRIALGDASALRVLHDRHVPWLRGRLLRRCDDGDVVFEALQDTFVAVWRSPGAWQGTGEVPAWLWGIAVRRLIGVLRSRKGWSPVAATDVPQEPSAPVALFGVEDVDELVTAMRTLGLDLQAAVRATYLDGLTVAEASILLGIPEGTVKTRVMRAKAQLRGALT